MNSFSHEPTHWLDSIKYEDPVITDQKLVRALELGVPAVLFTADQVDARVNELSNIEIAKYDEGSYSNILYVILERGGWPLATDIFEQLQETLPKMAIDTDSLGIEPITRNRNTSPTIVKPFSKNTRTTAKRVVLIDAAIRRGRTIETIRRALLDPTWTVQHGLGAAATSVSVIAVTRREDTELYGFANDAVSIGFTTPAGVETAGKGGDDKGESLRWAREIVIASRQPTRNKNAVEETLSLLSDRSVMGMDDIIWTAD